MPVPVPPWKRSFNRLDSRIRRVVSGESDRDFMARLYDEMLCRPPDDEAVSTGTRKLDTGLLRRGDLRDEVASSSEYRSGLPRWKRSLNRLDSRIRRAVSGESDRDFMARLYDEMLCRPLDVDALSAGTRKLGLGLARRGHLRREIASSTEFRSAVTVRNRRERLRRAPEPSTARSLAASPPEEIWLELTTRCNIVPPCAMCGYASSRSAAPRRDMDPRTWRSLLPLLREARNIGLHGAGEPLLYPFLGDLLLALRSSPAVVGFNSNGHLLTPVVSRRLVENGLGWISFSLDAATAPTYLRIRRRPDFEALLSKIHTLREIRDGAGAVRPELEINMTLMKENLPEATAFVELAARLGLERVMFQEIQPGGSQRVMALDGFVFDYHDQELTGDSRRDDALHEARERARSLGLRFSCEILYGSKVREETPEAPEATRAPGAVEEPAASGAPACAEPWRRLLVDVEGRAFVCCIQQRNQALLGRARHDTLEEIWNGRRARLVREAMFEGPAPDGCAGCYRTSASSC